MPYATILGEDDIEIEVRGAYSAGCKGSRSEYGAPMEPDDPEMMEVDPMGKLPDGSEIELTDEQLKQAEEHLYDALGDEFDPPEKEWDDDIDY